MEKKKENIRKGIIIGCILSAAVLIGILGSYAYFIGVGNNNQKEKMSVQTGNMALTFSDGNNGINESLNFGESIIKTFTIENTGSLEAKAKINWLNLVNTYLNGSLTYTLSYSETEDGQYTEIVTNKNVPVSETASTKMLVNNLTIPVGVTYYYKLEVTLNYLEDIDQTEDLNAALITQFILEEINTNELEGSEKTLAALNLSSKEEKPDFSLPATTDETKDGLYSMEDDYGTSYYFRGAVENNYVKFGDFYWRIIRINGDGSLRMIYDGTRAHANGENDIDRLALTKVAWNITNNYDAKYLGYMYGGTTDTESTSKEQAQTNETSSNIKIEVENWYKTNIRDKGLDNYVADSIYCNDRSIPGKVASEWSYDTELGYGRYYTAYGAASRFFTGHNQVALDAKKDINPKFICEQKNDAFTKEDTEKGNGTLEEKAGLITIDEVVTAGSGKLDAANNNYYLNKGNNYWTLTPFTVGVYVGNGCLADEAILFVIRENILGGNNVVGGEQEGVAPVISLTPEYARTLKGNGTQENPYEAR